MIERLERVVPEAPGRPAPLDIAEFMQQTTREIAFEPDSWTPERAGQIAAIFDSLAPSWSERINELRGDALDDALARGGVPTGLAIEVGSGTGIFTPTLAGHFARSVAVDISFEMLRLSPPEAAPRVCADAACLPLPDASADALVLVNCFLFGAEVARVLARDGTLVWVSTIGDRTPIYLGAEEVVSALPGEWSGRTADAGWGSWTVLRRA
jgi:SAM-dependent methyltransferase